MARGFDSKSVSDQQEELQRRREGAGGDKQKPRVSPRRRQLELARIDLLRRLEAAPEPHKDRLRQALAALDEQLARL